MRWDWSQKQEHVAKPWVSMVKRVCGVWNEWSIKWIKAKRSKWSGTGRPGEGFVWKFENFRSDGGQRWGIKEVFSQTISLAE